MANGNTSQACYSAKEMGFYRWDATAPEQATIRIHRWEQCWHLNATGKLQAPTHPIDLLIGRIRAAVLPYCYIHP